MKFPTIVQDESFTLPWKVGDLRIKYTVSEDDRAKEIVAQIGSVMHTNPTVVVVHSVHVGGVFRKEALERAMDALGELVQHPVNAVQIEVGEDGEQRVVMCFGSTGRKIEADLNLSTLRVRVLVKNENGSIHHRAEFSDPSEALTCIQLHAGDLLLGVLSSVTGLAPLA